MKSILGIKKLKVIGHHNRASSKWLIARAQLLTLRRPALVKKCARGTGFHIIFQGRFSKTRKIIRQILGKFRLAILLYLTCGFASARAIKPNCFAQKRKSQHG